ncbi:helix-turn-helix domain-containing protein [uncultured Megasphaera sp.]|uniref:helix-turn-helix domain-containing protein n=1 Tax=uncultured Megasphaera sp. TaxID=165188 RepID=UPI00266C7323|nr:helix-turn-helix transcriptional regulator [uncultured Megasphaera sp.]
MLHLKELRIEKGMSQTEVAREIGVSRQTYNFYENGKRDPDTAMVKTLADFFGVTADYLLGRNEKRKEDPSASADILEITALYEKLPKDKKELVLAMARAMVKD